jgi:hypothetical protein
MWRASKRPPRLGSAVAAVAACMLAVPCGGGSSDKSSSNSAESGSGDTGKTITM